jgi:P27 family predicted phage terminase small subunit
MQRYIDGEGPAPDAAPPGPPPVCPEWLDNDARQEWARIVANMPVLSPVDAMTLAAYCQTYSNWRKCEMQIRADGQTFTDNRGNLKIHPLARQAVSLLTEMRQIASKFGFSPRDRVGIRAGAPSGPEEEGFGEFLRGSVDTN